MCALLWRPADLASEVVQVEVRLKDSQHGLEHDAMCMQRIDHTQSGCRKECSPCCLNTLNKSWTFNVK
jgi:hypothetical protein